MSSFIEFVNSQLSFHERMADKLKANPKRAEKHQETAESFRKLLIYLESITNTSEQRPKKAIQLSLSFEEIEGLPPELVQELSVSDGDRMDFTIMRIVEELGGIASLDRILIGIYRETGEVMKRNTLTSRVYRMGQKNLLFPVPGKKGVYSLKELTEVEVAAILGE